MGFYYENQGRNTYLVYSLGDSDVLDNVSLGMITNNSIPGLAKTIYTQVDNNRYIKYNVTSKVTAKQFFSGIINKRMLMSLFTGITNVIITAEEYMIDSKSIVVDFDYIFVNVSSLEVSAISLPIAHLDESEFDYKQFFKDIIYNSQFDRNEDGSYLTKILSYINCTPKFSIVEFSDLLENIDDANYGAPSVDIGYANKLQNMNDSIPFDNLSTPSADVNSNYMNQNNAPININNNFVQQPAYANPNAPVQNSQSSAQWSSYQPQFNPQSNNTMMGGMPYVADTNTAYKQPESQYVQNAGLNMSEKSNAIPKQNVPFSANVGVAVPEASNNHGEYNSNSGATGNSEETDNKKGKFKLFGKKNKPEKEEKSSKELKKERSSKESKKEKTEKNTVSSSGFAIPGQNNVITPVIQEKKNEVPVVNQNVPRNTMENKVNVPAQKVQPSVPVNQYVQTPAFIPPVAPPNNGGGMNFGQTTVLNSGISGETTVLDSSMINQPQQSNPHLVRSRNNEHIPVNKPVFRIGKERSYVDYFIADNSAISRSHANIISRDGKYFVMDTNSTNHTYLDGNILQSNSEHEIVHGSKIRFADEDFEFRLY